MQLILAVSYGGRGEIVSAAKKISELVKRGDLASGDITEELFSRYLYAPDVPSPDLLIRTSDENRISNFLLWQLAYSEIIVTSTLWPDFSKNDFYKCLEVYGSRTRRFGMTDDQLQKG